MNLTVFDLLIYVAVASIVTPFVVLVSSKHLTSLTLRDFILKSGLALSLLLPAPIIAGSVLELGCLSSGPLIDPVTERETSANLPVTNDSFQLALVPIESTSVGVIFDPDTQIDEPRTLDAPDSSLAERSSRLQNESAQPIGSFDILTFASTCFVWIWGLGSVACCVHFGIRLSKIHILVTQSRELNQDLVFTEAETAAGQLNLAVLPEVRVCDRVASPAIVGVISPILMLPKGWLGSYDELARKQILTHELAHLKRRDQWILLMQSIASIIYWWNPLIRRMSGSISLLREMLCDDIAVEINGVWQSYAEAMLQMAEKSLVDPAGRLSLAMSASDLEIRLERVLNSQGNVGSLKRHPFLSALATIGLSLLFTSFAFAQFPSEKSNTVPVAPAAQNSDSAELIDKGTAPHQESESSSPKSQKSDDQKTVELRNGLPVFNRFKIPDYRHRVKVTDESGNAVPNALVEFRQTHAKVESQMRTDAEGIVEFYTVVNRRYGVLNVSSVDGSLGAIKLLFDSLQSGTKQPPVEPIDVDVQLSPMVSRQITVVNSDGENVAGATVVVTFPMPYANYRIMGEANARGMFSFKAPKESEIEAIVAFKDGYGLDYKSFRTPDDQKNQPDFSQPKFKANETRTLTLDTPKPFTTLVLDQQGKPVEDASVYPWLLKKGGNAQLNVSSLSDLLKRTTDSSGELSFEWFPSWQQTTVTLWPSKAGFDRPRGFWEPHKERVEIRLQRMTKITGRVLDKAGRPVSGARVVCDGRAQHEQTYPNFTDKDGAFRFMVRPKGEVVLSVVDNNASETRQVSDFVRMKVPQPESPIDDLVLRLVDATPVTFRVINQTSGKLVASHRTGVYRRAITVDDDSRIAKPDSIWGADSKTDSFQDAWPNAPSTYATPVPKHNGTWTAWLAPGVYVVRPNDGDQGEAIVVGSDPVTIDVHTATGAVSELRGKILLDGKPVADADITMTSGKFRGDRWTSTSREDGSYQVTMRENRSFFVAFSKDRKFATGIVADRFGERLNLNLERVASIKGQIRHEDGKPVAGKRIYFGTSRHGTEYGGFVLTDSLGNFVIENVCPNLELVLSTDTATGRVKIGEIQRLGAGEVRDLGLIEEWWTKHATQYQWQVQKLSAELQHRR